MRARLLPLVAATLGLVGVSGAAALADGKPAPPSRATFGIQPANAAGRIDRRPYLNYDVTPSAVITDRIVVVNYSGVPLTLSVYANDAINDNRGGFSLLTAQQKPSDAGSWIATGTPGGKGMLTVPARSTAVVPLRISVPSNASPGDHVAGVVASLSTLKLGKDGVNVRLDQRVAVRAFLRVSGRLRPELTIRPLRATYHQNWNPFGAGKVRVVFRVTNTGNVKLAGRQKVITHGLLGSVRQPLATPNLPLLIPGGAVDLSVQLPHVWPEVRVRTTVSVRPLLMPGDIDPGLRLYTASTTCWAIPWSLLLLTLGLLILALFVRRQRRRAARRKLTGADPGSPGPTAGPESAPGPRPVPSPVHDFPPHPEPGP